MAGELFEDSRRRPVVLQTQAPAPVSLRHRPLRLLGWVGGAIAGVAAAAGLIAGGTAVWSAVDPGSGQPPAPLWISPPPTVDVSSDDRTTPPTASPTDTPSASPSADDDDRGRGRGGDDPTSTRTSDGPGATTGTATPSTDDRGRNRRSGSDDPTSSTSTTDNSGSGSDDSGAGSDDSGSGGSGSGGTD
jgi:hypothetical protein